MIRSHIHAGLRQPLGDGDILSLAVETEKKSLASSAILNVNKDIQVLGRCAGKIVLKECGYKEPSAQSRSLMVEVLAIQVKRPANRRSKEALLSVKNGVFYGTPSVMQDTMPSHAVSAHQSALMTCQMLESLALRNLQGEVLVSQ